MKSMLTTFVCDILENMLILCGINDFISNILDEVMIILFIIFAFDYN